MLTLIYIGLFLTALVVALFLVLLGFAFGVSCAQATPAVKWFDERLKSEIARRASIEETRTAWREREERRRTEAAEAARESAGVM